jgi:GTP-binding protein Era
LPFSDIMTHKSGFVNIIGHPNTGKSTLLNQLVGERMTIISPKPQTTRHRIIALLNGSDFQIVFSDTPGLIREPVYKMQEIMNRSAHSSFQDADLILLLTEPGKPFPKDHPWIIHLNRSNVPVFLVINKIDLFDDETILKTITAWQPVLDFKECIPISALKGKSTTRLLELILSTIPEGPVYYPKDSLSDRPEKFFAAEIIREQVFFLYREEIPYSVQIEIESFKEEEKIIKVKADIYVAKQSQKSILIGKEGRSIKQLGMNSRKNLEEFFHKKIFLQLYVRVKKNWRDNEQALHKFGYQ